MCATATKIWQRLLPWPYQPQDRQAEADGERLAGPPIALAGCFRFVSFAQCGFNVRNCRLGVLRFFGVTFADE